MDELSDKQNKLSVQEARRTMLREINKITSGNVACAFLYHTIWFFIFHKSVTFPADLCIHLYLDQSNVFVYPGVAEASDAKA